MKREAMNIKNFRRVMRLCRITLGVGAGHGSSTTTCTSGFGNTIRRAFRAV